MEASSTTFVFGHWGSSSEETMQNEFPVHRSCRDGDVEELERLLSSGKFSVYDEDSFYGWTPAHWAAYFGRLDCLMKVIQYHCNNGREVTYTFSNNSVDLQTTRFGQTPSHVAAFAGNSQCLKWLLHCGANRDKQDYLGETSLHKAVRTGSLECTKMLTSHAASCCIRNKNGQLPKDLARACGYLSIAEYLKQVEEATKNGFVAEEEAMESSDASDGARPRVTPENDVLLDGAVAANAVPIGGRKRPRQTDEDNASKRCRVDPQQDPTAGDFEVPNLSFLFNDGATHSGGQSNINDISTSSLPNGDGKVFHFEGSPLFFSGPSVPTVPPPSEGAAMDDDEMIDDVEETNATEVTKPRSSVSCPRLNDRPGYPGSLEFGHVGVAMANPASLRSHEGGGTQNKMTHCFLSSANHYNNNHQSPLHRNRCSSSVSSSSSGWSDHCNSVLQEQDYCANYSQLMDDEMFQKIHGC